MLVRELTKRNASNSFCLVRRWGTLGSAAAHVIALANGRLCLRFSWGGLPEILLTYARNYTSGNETWAQTSSQDTEGNMPPRGR